MQKNYTNQALNDPGNHDCVITHLQPDCKVKWALGSITMNKATGGDEIPDELFQILKDDAVKVLHSVCQHLENSAVATGLEKVFSFQYQGKAMPKNVQTTAQLHSSYTLAKLMLKILQARLQQYVKRELQDVQAGFKKAEEPEIKLPTSAGPSKKQESSRKTSALLTMSKPLTVWITTNCRKFFRRWEYQTT